MKRLFPFIALFISLSLVSYKREQTETIDLSKSIIEFKDIDTNLLQAVKLPMPNSGTYSFEEAEKRKNEIYEMELTVRYFEWKNPTSGGAIHINKNDEIEVYQSTLQFMISEDKSVIIKSEELETYLSGFGFGNAASVLITSELDLKKSRSFELILNELFEPGIQLYYLKKNS
ncbi:MAG: hypothetical protein ACK476_04230 [Fluviicola sp.]|jgi:hypothetical protein